MLLMMPLQLLLLLLLLLLLVFDTDTAYLLPRLMQRHPCIGVCMLLGNWLWLLCLLLCNLQGVLPHLRHRMCRLPLFGAGGYSVL